MSLMSLLRNCPIAFLGGRGCCPNTAKLYIASRCWFSMSFWTSGEFMTFSQSLNHLRYFGIKLYHHFLNLNFIIFGI